VFDRRVGADAVAEVAKAFDEGWKVEVSPLMPSREYLAGLDQIAPLREAAARLCGGEEPAAIASAIEFLLEGLHLSNRLNKTVREHGARYARS
jgi:magnesium chelatase subunit I